MAFLLLYSVYIEEEEEEEVKPWSHDWSIAAKAYPSFCNMKQLGVFLLPLDGMLVHRRSLPHNLLSSSNKAQSSYTWVERGTVRVKCLAQEHITVSPARTRIRTARSGHKHTNHEATVPLSLYWMCWLFIHKLWCQVANMHICILANMHIQGCH